MIAKDPEKMQRVQLELDRLGEIFKDIDANKRDFVQRHIEQLAWYNVSIADLQEKVDQWGTLVAYDNGGGQSGIKPNPDVKTLLDYQKCCNTIIRTLLSLVPNDVSGSKLTDFFTDDFDCRDDIDYDARQRELNEQLRIAVERDKASRTGKDTVIQDDSKADA